MSWLPPTSCKPTWMHTRTWLEPQVTMKPRSLLASCSLLILASLCLVILLTLVINYLLPARARQSFGSPSPTLDGLEKVYLSIKLVLQENDLLLPTNPGGSSVPFRVEFGEPASLVIERLHAAGLIRNSEALHDYLQYSGLDTTLQAGDYQLSPSMNAVQIARTMQDATPTQVDFTILPGWRLDEIAASLATSGLEISDQEFLSSARQPIHGYRFAADNPIGSTMEGFLSPGTYQLNRDLTASRLLNTFLDNFNNTLTPELQQGFTLQGLDIYQAVTLASIVEREAVVAEEMPMIASVFLNRLNAGIKLDSDPTVQYAIGYNKAQNTWWTNPLSLQDLEIDSPYNTYFYPGLPLGPIANPGLTALQAVAYPKETPYYYFRAACDGSGRHVFAQTFEEHMGNACP